MEKFKAVDFMRRQKIKIWKKYEGLPLEKAMEKIHAKVESSSKWKKFLEKHRSAI